MVEKAIDDLVWSGKFDNYDKSDTFTAWMQGMPWHAQFIFDWTDVQAYSVRKCVEHRRIMHKLMQIQAFISDREMRGSLDPLIAHHKWLCGAYNNVSISNMVFRARYI